MVSERYQQSQSTISIYTLEMLSIILLNPDFVTLFKSSGFGIDQHIWSDFMLGRFKLNFQVSPIYL